MRGVPIGGTETVGRTYCDSSYYCKKVWTDLVKLVYLVFVGTTIRVESRRAKDFSRIIP